MPMRHSMRCPAGVAALRAIISRCTSSAQRTASTTLDLPPAAERHRL
jgi:hypothetical protein